ncbi:MAG: ABC transporter substrate-binding protein, partial [Candidatus Saccharimonadales bacterium]
AVDSFNGDATAAAKSITRGLLQSNTFSAYNARIPRYVAVFFNTQNGTIFGDSNLRKALSYAVDANAVTQSVEQQTGIQGQTVDSPLLPQFFGYQNPQSPYSLNANQADAFMEKAGFKQNDQGQWVKAALKKPAFQFTQYLKQGSIGTQVTQLQLCLERLDPGFKKLIVNDPAGSYTKNTDAAVTLFQQKYLPQDKPTGETGTSTRQKLNELCFTNDQQGNQFALTLTTVSQPQLLAAAEAIKKQWESFGIQVNIQAANAADISSIIENRTYDALLYGETLGMQPDLYPFWYSSQKIYPGLNLSSYENSSVDKLLLAARQAIDDQTAQQTNEQIQDSILADAPAVFLYSPDYT